MTWWGKLGDVAVGAITDQLTQTGQWGSLNKDLIAVIAPLTPLVDSVYFSPANGAGFVADQKNAVSAPVKDGTVDYQFNWTSPFESMNPDSKSPSYMAAIQAGGAAQVLQTATAFLKANDLDKYVPAAVDSGAAFAQKVSEASKGRTGITKMNSRQVFSGNAPVKVQLTLVFRAAQDPKTEVVEPIRKLLKMAHPEKLADSYLDALESLNGTIKAGMTPERVAQTLFPSEAPGFVSLTYKGETYAPMVIESISKPMTAPYSTMGDLFVELQITLASRESWDSKNIAQLSTNKLGALVDEALSAATSLF